VFPFELPLHSVRLMFWRKRASARQQATAEQKSSKLLALA